jgi:hypothetical protein
MYGRRKRTSFDAGRAWYEGWGRSSGPPAGAVDVDQASRQGMQRARSAVPDAVWLAETLRWRGGGLFFCDAGWAGSNDEPCHTKR